MSPTTTSEHADARWRRPASGYLLAYALLAAALGVALVLDLDVVAMLRDPQAQTGAVDSRPWIGLLSVVGGLLWAAAATCCLVGAWACRVAGGPDDARFLTATGALLAVLGLDDALVVHDHVAPWVTGRAGSEKLVIAGCGLLAAAWAVAFRHRLLGPDGVPVAFAGACFAASLAVDTFVAGPGTFWQVAEDGFKLAGIVTFLHAATWWCRRALRPALEAGAAPPAPV